MLDLEGLEQAAALLQRLVEERPAVKGQEVEDHQGDGDILPQLFVHHLAPEAVLKLEEAQDSTITMG